MHLRPHDGRNRLMCPWYALRKPDRLYAVNLYEGWTESERCHELRPHLESTFPLVLTVN